MQLLLAPSGRGKTAYVLQLVRTVLVSEPLAPVWVVLPNQEQVRAFRQRLAWDGGALGVQTGTFYSVYAEILARAGRLLPRLFDPVQHRLLRAAVDRLCQQDALQHYAPLRDKPGFLRLLRALILELKRARVLPEDLHAALAGEAPRLTELARIYQLYQEWLNATRWADADGQGWLAALALEEEPALCRDLRLVAVDGFDEFNPTQLAVLHLLAGRAAETVVTLTGDRFPAQSGPVEKLAAPPDPPPSRLAHRRFARAQQALFASAGQPTVSPASQIHTRLLDTAVPDICGPLAHLEANLFEPHGEQQAAGDAVLMIEAQNRAEEARVALRWIKERLVRDGLGPDQVAVLARNLEPYRPHLIEVAAEFGLPLHLASGGDLATNPAVAALLNLLSLPVQDWPRRAVLDALRSPYFDWSAKLAVLQAGKDRTAPDDRPAAGDQVSSLAASEGLATASDVAAALDAVSRAARVIGGLAQWHDALERLAAKAPAAGSAGAQDDEDRAPPGVPAGQQAQALRRVFDALVARLQPPAQATIPQFVAFVEDLIGEDPELAPRFQEEEGQDGSLRMVTAARTVAGTEQRDVAALRAFKDVLRGLVLAESITSSPPLSLGGGPVSYSRFFEELRGAVEAASFRLPMSQRGAVLAAPVLRARGLSFQAVALLGLSEGEFPQPEREDPLLREADRLALRGRGLPLEPRLRGDEATFFYEAITRARQRLLLTRPYLADDGQPWEPSPYWLEARRLLEARLERRRPEDAVALEQVASQQELLVGLAQSLQPDASPAEPTTPEQPGPAVAPAPAQRAARQFPQAAWQSVQHTAAVLQARLASQPAGPYEGDLAALQERLQARYRPAHVWSSSRLEAYATCPFNFFIGSGLSLEPRVRAEAGFDQLILGSVYHQVLETLYRRALQQGDWSLEALDALLPEVAKATLDAAPEQYGFRPTPLWAYQRQELTQILRRTVEGLAAAAEDYAPLALERAFGIEGQPPLVISTDHGELRLRGYIDRLDQGPDGRLRIVDYKSGSTAISVQDLDKGRRIQLPLYALAARDALGLGQVADGFYWHIGSARPSGLRLESYQGGVEAALEVAVQHALAHVRNIRAGRFQPRPPAGGCPPSCPAIGFCWRYRPRRQ